MLLQVLSWYKIGFEIKMMCHEKYTTIATQASTQALVPKMTNLTAPFCNVSPRLVMYAFCFEADPYYLVDLNKRLFSFILSLHNSNCPTDKVNIEEIAITDLSRRQILFFSYSSYHDHYKQINNYYCRS
jgi:hypothetical protein